MLFSLNDTDSNQDDVHVSLGFRRIETNMKICILALLIERLGGILSETKAPFYAWALIPNYCHLLVRTGGVPLVNVMCHLLTGYAMNFNHPHRRHVHLFHNCYKSILCHEQAYLSELVR